jgi:hypothetical protein
MMVNKHEMMRTRFVYKMIIVIGVIMGMVVIGKSLGVV